MSYGRSPNSLRTRLQASVDVIGFGLVVAALLVAAANALFGGRLTSPSPAP